MSSNVGLSTPRGSGTSGYVQRNLSHLRTPGSSNPYPDNRDSDISNYRQRKPDQEILEHDRKREIEAKVFELRDKLEDEEMAEDEIEEQCTALRAKLSKSTGSSSMTGAQLKSHQVHELAEAKIKQQEKLRSALGIRKDYQEGDHWRKQENKTRTEG